MQVGGLDVLPVMDGTARFPASEAYRFGPAGRGGDAAGTGPAGRSEPKGTRDEDWAPHRGLLDGDGTLVMALGGFLLRTGTQTVVIDAGVGARSRPPFLGGQLLESLAGHGVRPTDVTDVVFTHLHFDHVGWATTGGRIVFPNATYRCDQRDWDHFVTHDPDGGGARKLRPIADRLATWDRDGTILPGLDALGAPGHTPGSTVIVVSDGEDRALLLGDVVHCPVELLDDEWAGIGDVDPELAQRTRVALAREIEEKNLPVAAGHFPGLEFGRLLAAAGRRHWVVNPT